MKNKLFFRFLRGELNGKYITNLHGLCNTFIDNYILKTLTYFKNFKFQKIDELPPKENEIYNINTTDLHNILIFAGMYQFLTSRNLNETDYFIKMTEIVKDDVDTNKFYTTQQLWNTNNQNFEVIEDVTGDIVNYADDTHKMSVVPNDYHLTTRKYIWYGIPMFDDMGNFLEENLKDTPPDDPTIPYQEYYGSQFQSLSFDKVISYISKDSLIIQLFNIVQSIKYNGSNQKAFFDITELLCSDFLKINSYTQYNSHWELSYIIDENAITSQYYKFTLWDNLTNKVFPLIHKTVSS